MLTLVCVNKVLYQNFTVIHSRLYRYGTALPEEQLGQHEILRAQAVCGRALRMTLFLFEGGCAPFTPACECDQSNSIITVLLTVRTQKVNPSISYLHQHRPRDRIVADECAEVADGGDEGSGCYCRISAEATEDDGYCTPRHTRYSHRDRA